MGFSNELNPLFCIRKVCLHCYLIKNGLNKLSSRQKD